VIQLDFGHQQLRVPPGRAILVRALVGIGR
jgi:hypothetical protein